jgi:sugar O-acyltransferase (sialic acid O-acetyltransferase NeuD family)
MFGLIGAGGHAREVMPMSEPALRAQGFTDVFYVQTKVEDAVVNGCPVISEKAFAALEGDKYFNVGIGDSKVRAVIANRMALLGIKPMSLVAENATIYQENEIGQGAILSSQTTITSNIKIGNFFHANMHSYVAHDCVIGDFVTFAPGVCCNGNVWIGDHAYIGSGAILRNGTPDKPLKIGAGAVVGMGAVVTKNVAPNTVVYGSPAKQRR